MSCLAMMAGQDLHFSLISVESSSVFVDECLICVVNLQSPAPKVEGRLFAGERKS